MKGIAQIRCAQGMPVSYHQTYPVQPTGLNEVAFAPMRRITVLATAHHCLAVPMRRSIDSVNPRRHAAWHRFPDRSRMRFQQHLANLQWLPHLSVQNMTIFGEVDHSAQSRYICKVALHAVQFTRSQFRDHHHHAVTSPMSYFEILSDMAYDMSIIGLGIVSSPTVCDYSSRAYYALHFVQSRGKWMTG